MTPNHAPGKPGDKPHWTSAAKTGVGTALGADSPVWFTLSRGIVTEVFYPFVDTASSRSLGLIVTDRHDYYSNELQDVESTVSYASDGVPCFQLKNRCKSGRYEIEKTILTDPRRPVLLQQVRFRPLKGNLGDYSLYAMLTPHLANQGADNTAWVGDYKGVPMLFAKRTGYALALACSAPWLRRSVGFLGQSDGRMDLELHNQMLWKYERADGGNVALTGEIDLGAREERVILALGFGRNENDAGHRARASLLQGFEAAREEYVRAWERWQEELLPISGSMEHRQNIYRISAGVMRVHESKEFPGGIVASLAIPWGAARGDKDRGYHLVWPRDMIQTVGGLLAVAKHEDARRILFYLHISQEPDGHWPQNMFLNGNPSWNGIQLDETAFVILLVNFALREGALGKELADPLWEMVRKAAGYLVRQGPVTPMDRWEEEAGYFASTMAVEIAALLAAASVAEKRGETLVAKYFRETADTWNAEIESLIYVTGTKLAREVGVDGYYVRFALPDQRSASQPAAGSVTLKNHRSGEGQLPVADIVSPDALALVRFGLRAADDPRIVNTVRVIDHLLRVETPFGPAWRRYNEDGYGERADGSPFDGTGIGRAWPLLTGERAHYELAAGRIEEAERLCRTMERFANDSGLIPEQVWDSRDIPEHELQLGRPSGSAMPLVWAHAEYCKLRRSLENRRIFDLPTQTVERYLQKPIKSPRTYWRFDQPCRAMPAGQLLRFEVLAAARVHWSSDEWQTTHENPTQDSGLGIHYVDLPTDQLAEKTVVQFTFFWLDAGHWEGKNFLVKVEGRIPEPSPAPTAQATRTPSRRPARGPVSSETKR